jgi:hypothetical protein
MEKSSIGILPRITDKQISCIWVLAKTLGMVKEDVYALAYEMAGAECIHGLNVAEAGQIIDRLKTRAGQETNTTPRGRATTKQLAMINALAIKMDWDETRLRRFCEERFKVSHLKFLTDEQARKVTEALKAMLAGGRSERRKKANG